MKIVVLDGYTLNPGDLTWDGLCELGEVSIYDRSTHHEVVERASGAEVVLTNKTMLTREILEQLPDLKYIGVLATGYNVVDVEAAREKDIPVTNVPVYGTASVAQAVFAHVLNLAQHTAEHAATVKDGRWCSSKDFCYWDYPLIELQGLTMGIIGFGRIGRATADLARAFGMEVLAYDIFPQSDPPDGVRLAELYELVAVSDFISLHCPLTSENQGMINKELISRMKNSAFLINTSRGPLVDEADLADGLNKGLIAGAGLDVLSVEPASEDNPLLSAKNCYITPHIAWATHAARSRLLDTAVSNIRSFIAKQAENVVNLKKS